MSQNPLEALIRQKIVQTGAVTFRDYMELALYQPDHGYYASGRAGIGRKGDFFTNVSVGVLFGQLLAEQFREMWKRLGGKQPFTVVEQGAGSGDFARDVLAWTRNVAPDFFDALCYVIVEPFEKMRERQATTLGGFAARVQWRDSLDQLEPFCGVHFSNELLDAFPVHLVRFADGEWRERGVSCNDEKLQWLDLPIPNSELKTRTAFLPKTENYTTEINLDALAWCDQLAAKLQRGWVLTIDYGYPRQVFYTPERSSGTLSCYAKHQRTFDPLQNPGAQDITAHVDFTSLAERAEKNGLKISGFTDQHHFIVALAKEFFAQHPPNPKQSRALQTLMHPQFLGTVFKVLALERDTGSTAAPLRGLEFAGDARAALGLAK